MSLMFILRRRVLGHFSRAEQGSSFSRSRRAFLQEARSVLASGKRYHTRYLGTLVENHNLITLKVRASYVPGQADLASLQGTYGAL